MPSDHISRRKAKEAIEDALAGSLMHIEHHRTLALAALDKLPALEAEGRWEKLRAYINHSRVRLTHDEGFNAGMDFVIREMDRLDAPAPSAAEGTERPPC